MTTQPEPAKGRERRFPIQDEWAGRDARSGEVIIIPATSVPWGEAEIAYQTYSAIYVEYLRRQLEEREE